MMINRAVTLLVVPFTIFQLLGCSTVANDAQQFAAPTEAQLMRKQRSETKLLAEGVPVNQLQPVIADASDVRLRNDQEVQNRALCLLLVGVKAEQLGPKLIQKIISEYELQDDCSPQEMQFINADDPSGKEMAAARWRYESAQVMFWAVGLIDELSRPDQFVNVPKLVRLTNSLNAGEFRRTAALRSVTEIVDAADLIYRYHWAAHDKLIVGDEPPSGLLSPVIYERHYAFNWLIGHKGQEWDDVTTETNDPAHEAFDTHANEN